MSRRAAAQMNVVTPLSTAFCCPLRGHCSCKVPQTPWRSGRTGDPEFPGERAGGGASGRYGGLLRVIPAAVDVERRCAWFSRLVKGRGFCAPGRTRCETAAFSVLQCIWLFDTTAISIGRTCLRNRTLSLACVDPHDLFAHTTSPIKVVDRTFAIRLPRQVRR